jgi:acetylornithine deacetylase
VVSIDWRARVLQAVDDNSQVMLTALTDLVRAPSVSGSDIENSAQGNLAEALVREVLDVDYWPIPLDDMLVAPDFPGVEVSRTEAWGLVGVLASGGDGPRLMFNGHIDVVPPGDRTAWSDDPFAGRVRGGALYGRGACDMKAGLAAAWWAVRALRRSGVPLRGDVLLTSVQGEEDGGLGAYALLARGWRADACVIPEPTSLGLVTANAGALTFRLRVRGLATHASRRTDGVSAIEKFWPVWRALHDLECRRNREVHPLFARWPIAYPISIGTVRSGDWVSSVPDLLVAEGRLGVALGEPVEHARAELEHAICHACADDPWLVRHPVEVQWWGGQFAPGEVPANSDLPDHVRAAHARVTGDDTPVWGAPYGSDLRLLTGKGGIPTVQYGPGDAALAHAPDERVPLREVVTCARVLALLAVDYCGVG